MSDLFPPPPSEQTGSLPFPQPLSEKYAPRRIADFVGLTQPKRVLANFCAQPYSSAWLFWGPSGTGKTSMALAMCEEIPAELTHVGSRDCDLETVQRTAYHCHFVPWQGKRMHLVLVDEAPEMSYAAQDAFLSKLDGTEFPPSTVFVFTANAIDRLAEPFRSRCRVLRFEPEQPVAEISAYLAKVWASERPSAVPPDFERIARDSGSNLRSAIMKLELILLGLVEPEPAPAPPVKATCGIMPKQKICPLCQAVAIPKTWHFCNGCWDKKKAARRARLA